MMESVARTRRIAACVGLASYLGLAACSLARRTPEIRYYTLAPPGDTPSRLAQPVRVGTFTADQPYTTERIAYRTSPYRLDYYNYHRWAADPRRLVEVAVRDYLERAQPPAGPEGPSSAGRQGAADLLELEGHIRRIEETDEPAGWHGALALDLKVRHGGTVLLERSYAETEPAAARNPEAIAAALSRALGRILDRLIAELPAVDAASAPPPKEAPVMKPRRTTPSATKPAMPVPQGGGRN
jgi:ABC-type uncharacterized transport system auxiliary subunit